MGVTKDLIDISLADSTTGWAGLSGGLDDQVFKQGTGSWTYQTPKNGIGNGNFTPASNINMTSNYTIPHLYWTMRCDVFPFCEALNTGSTNSGLMLKVSDGSGNYLQWHIDGNDTWDGSWKDFVFDLTNTTKIHSSSGTLSLADVDKIEWITDNSNSGTIRIIDNTWIDAVRYGQGLKTTTDVTQFITLANEDALVANHFGVSSLYKGVIFMQGGILAGDDSTGDPGKLNSDGEAVYYPNLIVDVHHYDINIVNKITSIESYAYLQNGIIKSVNPALKVDFNFGVSVAIKFVYFKAQILVNLGDMIFRIQGATSWIKTSSFTDCGTIEMTSQNSHLFFIDACNFLRCKGLTLNTLTYTYIKNSHISFSEASVAMITCDDLSQVTDNLLENGLSNIIHAIELSTIGNGTMDFKNTFIGIFASVDGSTGTEHIYVNVASGNLTINVIDGYDTPTIRTAGAVVTVAVAQRNFSFNLNPSITAYEWRIYTVDAAGSLVGSVEIDGEESASVDNQTYTYSYISDTQIAVQILGHSNDIVESVTYYTLKDYDQSFEILLKKDNNN